MNRVHDGLDPGIVLVDKLGSVVEFLARGEEGFDLGDAVLQESFLQGAKTLGIGHDLSHIIVRKNFGGLLGLGVKNGMLHIFFFLLRVVVFAFGSCFADERIQDIFLFVVHCINDILNRFVLFFGFCHFVFLLLIIGVLELFRLGFGNLFLGILFLLFFLFFFFIRVGVANNLFARVNYHGIVIVIAMSENTLNGGTGVSASKNKANLTDDAVDDILFRRLSQMIGPDGKTSDIAVNNLFFSILREFGLVEGAVTPNTFLAIFQVHMTQNIGRVVVLMPPTKRNTTAILIFKCILSDRTTVRTSQIIFGDPTFEIVRFLTHFEIFLLMHVLLVRKQVFSAKLHIFV